MKKPFRNTIVISDKGETMIEVVVAFIVLLIVLAVFTTAVNSASSAQLNSIDNRREADSDYLKLRDKLLFEKTNAGEIPGSRSEGINTIVTVTGTDGDQIDLTAYKYIGGETIYWVYR